MSGMTDFLAVLAGTLISAVALLIILIELGAQPTEGE